MKHTKKAAAFLAVMLAFTLLLSACGGTPASQSDTTSDVYTQSAQGNNGPVTVEVEIADGAVTRVEVVENSETEGIADKPISEIPAWIVENKSLAVDTVSGATNTSNAIVEVVALCLDEAGLDAEEWKSRTVEVQQEAKEDVTCDTVVVGAGGAGIRVALELADNGQNVILVEKQSMVGGATNLAATYFVAVDTTYQQEDGMTISIDDYVAQTAETNPDIDSDRLRLLLENSQESLDWLNSLGTNITRPLSNYQVATEDGSSLGAAIVKAMSSALEQSSVDLRLDTEAVEILTEDGAVTGVRVQDAGGEYSILADSVVLASGGFVSGTEAVEKYAPEWAGLLSTSAAGSTGEMFGLVEQIGGVLSNMDVVRLNPSVHSENGVNSSLSAARAEGGIIVNQQGLRFCNDYYPDYTTLSKWMVEQEGDYVYILIDQTAMDNSKRLQGFKDMGYFLEADTLEELADKMGVPADNLVKTVEAYQEAVRTGVDEFGRTNNLSIDFSNPPYYAVTTSPDLQVSLGGILVDDTMRVQKQDGTSFDNLYAVGECADDGLFGCAPTNINITFGKMVADQILGR